MLNKFFLQDMKNGQYAIWQITGVFWFYGKLTVQALLVATDTFPIVSQKDASITAKFRVSTVATKFIPVNS